MAVTPEQARAAALALAGASAAQHFHRIAFRTPRKIFATLDPAAGDLNLVFDPHHRDHWCEIAPHAFAPVPGGWGRLGATRCDLSQVHETELAAALAAAHRLAQPRPETAKTRR